MSWSDFFYIDPAWKALFDRHGVDNLGSLLDWQAGALVERENGSEVWRVSMIDDAGVERALYLKKYFIYNSKRFRSEFFRAFFWKKQSPERVR